jgi:NAD(P)-dependent dehydrogenase (short-subunit alcohol dehydrogenase family)
VSSEVQRGATPRRPAGGERPVALITGTSSGFGLATSVELARRGFRVFATMRDLDRSERLDRAVADAGVEVETLQLDVTSDRSVQEAVSEVLSRAGRVDVLVNNAGFGMGGMLEDLTLDELREQFETNFFGVVRVTKAVLPSMRERRSGRIINMSSISGRVAVPGLSAYCSAKFALEGLSDSLRLELSRYGIRVVVIEPGSFRTDIFERNKRMARRALDPESPNYAATMLGQALLDRRVPRMSTNSDKVARLIARAATARRPRARYVIGAEARAQLLATAVLPGRVIEAFTNRMLRPRDEIAGPGR